MKTEPDLSPRSRIARFTLLLSVIFSGASLLLFMVLLLARKAAPLPSAYPALVLGGLFAGSLLALRFARRDINLTIEIYAWGVVACISAMLFNYYQIQPGSKPPTILFLLHVAILFLGLARGWRASLRLTIGVLLVLVWITYLSGQIGGTFPLMLAALAVNLPPWLVDRLEHDVRRAEERFSLVFRDAPDITLVVDSESFRILEANRAAMGVLAESLNQIRLLSFSVILPLGPEYIPRLTKQDNSEQHAKVATLQARHLRSHFFPVDLTAALIPWGTGQAYLLTLRDVTLRVQAELKLERYRLRLEELVADRTCDLETTNQKLVERSSELEEMHASLNAFSRIVAHDLKNTLTVVQGNSELLMKDLKQRQVATNAAKYSRTVMANVGRMNCIIDELLLLAGIQQGKDAHVRVVDMAEIWREAGKRMKELIEETGALVSAPNEWPTVLGYEPWLELVWANFLSNALKYSGRKNEGVPPKIEAGWSQCSDLPADNIYAEKPGPKKLIEFWLADNGQGIAKEAQCKLFNEITRLDTLSAAGHGLGLVIVKRIITQLGGTVGVTSSPGVGSRFSFTLPAP